MESGQMTASELGDSYGIDEVMAELELDALLFPASSGAGIAARVGCPVACCAT